MDALHDALTESREGTILSLDVAAGAKENRFPSGYNPWRKSIGCNVRAPPVGGKANAAVVRLLAGFFSIHEERVQILSGGTSHQKRILLKGLGPPEVLDILARSSDPGI